MRHFATLWGKAMRKNQARYLGLHRFSVVDLRVFSSLGSHGRHVGTWLFALVEGLTTYERENEWFKIWYDDDD